jgi:hypothetical protein
MVSKRLGLLIATTGYADSRFPSVPVRPAQINELAEVLQTAQIGGFTLTVLIDPGVEEVRSAILDLFADRGPDDLVLLYFIGDFIRQIDGSVFLAVQETIASDLKNTALPANAVQLQLQATAARNQIVILDGRLGSVAEIGTLIDQDSPWNVGLNFCVFDRDQAILATRDYLSFCLTNDRYSEVRPAKPLLAEAIVRGLRSRAADENADQQITVSELLRYLNRDFKSNRNEDMLASWVSERAGTLLVAFYPETGIDQSKSTSFLEPEVSASGPEKKYAPFEEDVKFTAYRPGIMHPEQWRRMIVFMHLDDELESPVLGRPSMSEEIETRARQILGAEYDDYRNVVTESRAPIVRESEISLVPEVPGIQFNPPRRSFFWATGLRVHEESFFMRAPFALGGKQVRGQLSIFFGQLLLAEIPLKLRVAEHVARAPVAKEENWAKGVAKPFRKIFASYSHKDAEIVEAMERHIRAIGYEYLRDVVQLRSGQRWDERLMTMISDADIFQLFWSRNSAQSVQVEKEWRYAVGLQRQTFVRPAYWEIPMSEPPEPLRRLHFYLLPGILPAVRRKKEDVDKGATPAADTRGLDDGPETNEPSAEAPPPARSPVGRTPKGAETKSEEFRRGAAEAGFPAPQPDPEMVPRMGDRPMGSPQVDRGTGASRSRRREFPAWLAILGGVVGSLFVILVSIDLASLNWHRPGKPGSTPDASATVPTPQASPLPTASAPVSPAPIATPDQSIFTPVPNQPLVRPTAEPSVPPTGVESLVSPSPFPVESPSPTRPLVVPSPTASGSPASRHRRSRRNRRSSPTPTIEPSATPLSAQPLVSPSPVPTGASSLVEPQASASPTSSIAPSDDTDLASPTPHRRHNQRYHRQHYRE